MVSDHPWGPYRVHGLGTVQPDEAPVRAYAGQIVHWQDQWIMAGFLLGPGDTKGEAIADPIAVQATPQGIKQA